MRTLCVCSRRTALEKNDLFFVKRLIVCVLLENILDRCFDHYRVQSSDIVRAFVLLENIFYGVVDIFAGAAGVRGMCRKPMQAETSDIPAGNVGMCGDIT